MDTSGGASQGLGGISELSVPFLFSPAPEPGSKAGCSRCEGQAAGGLTGPESLGSATGAGRWGPGSRWGQQHGQGEVVRFPPFTSFVLLKQA